MTMESSELSLDVLRSSHSADMWNRLVVFLLLSSCVVCDARTTSKQELRSCTFQGSVADPSDCSSYYNCVNRKLYHYHCGDFSVFDTTLKTCVSPPKDPSCIKTKTGAGKVKQDDDVGKFICTEDGYFPDPMDCRRFYRCSKNSKHAFACPVGLGFDAFKITCDPIEQVNDCDYLKAIRKKESNLKQSQKMGKQSQKMGRHLALERTQQAVEPNLAEKNQGLEDKFYLNFDGVADFDDYISLEEAARMAYQLPPEAAEGNFLRNQPVRSNPHQQWSLQMENQAPEMRKLVSQYIEPKEGKPVEEYGTYNPWNVPYVEDNVVYMSDRKREGHISNVDQNSMKRGTDRSRNIPQIQNIPTGTKKKELQKEKRTYQNQRETSPASVGKHEMSDPKYSIAIEWDSKNKDRADNSYDVISADIAYDYPYDYDQVNSYSQQSPYYSRTQTDSIKNLAKEGRLFQNQYISGGDPYFSNRKRSNSPNYIPFQRKEPFRCPHDGYFKDYRDCSRFYHCTHGLPYLVKCNGGLFFNPVNKICDWPARVPGCSDRMRKVFVTSSARRLRLNDEPNAKENSEKGFDYSNLNKTDNLNNRTISKQILNGEKWKVKTNKKKEMDVKENKALNNPLAETELNQKQNDVTKSKHLEQTKQQNRQNSNIVEQPRGVSHYTRELTTIVENDCTEAGFFRHPTDCSIFYRCTAEAKFQYLCDTGLAFHTTLKACVAREYVKDC